MTNTNDFRKFTTRTDYSALIQSFSYTRGSELPKTKPQYESPERKLKLTEGKGIKSRAQLLHEQKKARLQVIRICIVAALCLGMICVVLNSFALRNELTRQISRQETAIANAQSEYISLEAELNSLVSISMIDKYAVEKLGMSKARSGQVQYMDVDEFTAQFIEKEVSKTPAASAAPLAIAAAAAQPKQDKSKDKEKSSNEDKASSKDDGINN